MNRAKKVSIDNDNKDLQAKMGDLNNSLRKKSLKRVTCLLRFLKVADNAIFRSLKYEIASPSEN